jgi:2-dehydro-3-deoxyphosphogluconate aldolase/(4S)-4-hydroxy-2-oxoglutarate aldolase
VTCSRSPAAATLCSSGGTRRTRCGVRPPRRTCAGCSAAPSGAGVRAVEVPVQRPDDLRALRAVAAAARGRGLSVGAGTILGVEQLDAVRRAGAAYTVSPGVDEDVIRASLVAGLPTLPGVATASDIQRCTRMGLRWLKAFPAAVLGPGWITAMRGPFPEARFVATGGVSLANAPAFLAAGARVVSLGSALTDPARAADLSGLALRAEGPRS